MTIAVGDKVPNVNFVKPTAEGPQPLSSDALFAGKRVALFSVPGAFTPTCSAKHLPGFVEKAAELKAKGIDDFQLYYAMETLQRLGSKTMKLAAKPVKGRAQN